MTIPDSVSAFACATDPASVTGDVPPAIGSAFSIIGKPWPEVFWIRASAVSTRPKGRLELGSPVVIASVVYESSYPGHRSLGDLLQLIGAILGTDRVAPSDRLTEDLGAESMDVVNIVAAVEEHFQVTLDDADLAGVRTVADLDEVVRAALR